MNLGKAKIDQETVTLILREVPIVAGDDDGTGVLIGAHDLAQVLGIELTGEAGGVHQVTKQHRELAALRLGETGRMLGLDNGLRGLLG
jgi:hypothetical protein